MAEEQKVAGASEPTIKAGLGWVREQKEVVKGAAYDIAAVTVDPIEEKLKELEARIEVLEKSLIKRIEAAFKRIGHAF